MEDRSIVVYLRLPRDLIVWLDDQAKRVQRTRNGYMWRLLVEERARVEEKEVMHEPA